MNAKARLAKLEVRSSPSRLADLTDDQLQGLIQCMRKQADEPLERWSWRPPVAALGWSEERTAGFICEVVR